VGQQVPVEQLEDSLRDEPMRTAKALMVFSTRGLPHFSHLSSVESAVTPTSMSKSCLHALQ
jgi:hypothetical protein